MSAEQESHKNQQNACAGMFFISIAAIILFVVFKSHAPDYSDRCETGGDVSCDCANSYTLYEISYLAYTVCLFIRWVIRMVQICSVKGWPNRKQMKQQEKVNLSISLVLFTLSFVFLLTAYEMYKDACEGTQLFTESSSFASALRVICGFHWLFIVVTLILAVCPCCNREAEPVEDQALAQRRHLREQIEHDFRLAQLSHLNDRMEQRQEPARTSIIQRIDNHISFAAKKTHDHALKAYLLTLLNVPYGNYNETVPGANCAICQQEFKREEEIVVFECNPHHYFHKQCGADWLEIKTNCPLCQRNFEEEVMKHALTKDKKLIKHLSAQDPQDIILQPDSPQDQEMLRIQSIEAQNHIRNALTAIDELANDFAAQQPQVVPPAAQDNEEEFMQELRENQVHRDLPHNDVSRPPALPQAHHGGAPSDSSAAAIRSDINN